MESRDKGLSSAGCIYLDYAATTPVHPDVLEAMLPFFREAFGNPSAAYSCGREAREAVETAREQVAGLIGAGKEEIVFTGGGTEADNLAITGVAYASQSRGNHIITTAIEHHAVLETCRSLEKKGFAVTYLPVDGCGMIDPDDVARAITGKTVLISVMHANNEIGTVEPVAEIGKIAGKAGVYFHTDAVQTAGRIPVNVDEIGADLLSMSAHKIYGPKGVGALYVRKGTKLEPHIHGGGQERGRRSGTENVPGIVGLGKAAGLARLDMDRELKRLIGLRDMLSAGLVERVNHARLNGHPVRRLPNNVNISFDFIEGESLLISLDREGICASAGSACASGSLKPSYVLLATGLSPAQAHGCLRLTLGRWTTEEDIQRVLNVLPALISDLRDMSPFLKSREQA